jgi:hypothetical protein
MFQPLTGSSGEINRYRGIEVSYYNTVSLKSGAELGGAYL